MLIQLARKRARKRQVIKRRMSLVMSPVKTMVVRKGGQKKAISSEKIATNSEKILELIRQKPTISVVEIAKLISMSSRGVEKYISKLRKVVTLKRIGADKGGYWVILQ